MRLTDLEQQYVAWITSELRENGCEDSADETSQVIVEKAVNKAEKINLRGKNA